MELLRPRDMRLADHHHKFLCTLHDTAQHGLTQRADTQDMLQEQCPSSCPKYEPTSGASLQDSPPLTFT